MKTVPKYVLGQSQWIITWVRAVWGFLFTHNKKNTTVYSEADLWVTKSQSHGTPQSTGTPNRSPDPKKSSGSKFKLHFNLQNPA